MLDAGHTSSLFRSFKQVSGFKHERDVRAVTRPGVTPDTSDLEIPLHDFVPFLFPCYAYIIRPDRPRVKLYLC